MSLPHDERVVQSREFCRSFLGVETNDELFCAPEYISQNRHHILSQQVDASTDASAAAAASTASVTIKNEETEKKVFTIEMADSDSVLYFTIDNYVHVTHLYNCARPDEQCKFNLDSMAISLMPYYVEYSCKKKFAKINLRHYKGLSHLIYGSLVIVETGSDNQLMSTELLGKTLHIINHECGYPNIRIKRRRCQNIVSNGHLNAPICLNVLKHRFHAAFYDPSVFPGAVVKLRDLERHFNVYLEDRDNEMVFTGNYVDTDDDGEIDENEWIEAIKMTDEYELLKMHKRHNATFLVFHQGHTISTGCKSEKELLHAFHLLYLLLDKCKDNTSNQKLEHSIKNSFGK
jgi:TATA-box binding protein (TBP) (component of TFIID and TFIIIB)